MTATPPQAALGEEGRPADASVHRVEQHGLRYALALLLVVGVGRPELHRLVPQLRALGAAGGARPRLQLLGADLDLDLGDAEDVLVPAWMLRRGALGGDDDVAVAGLLVEQRAAELVARLAARRRQQQRRLLEIAVAGRLHLVDV